MQLSQNFTLAEFTRSATAARLGIDNTPSDTVIVNLVNLCHRVLQPLRSHAGIPLRITSGYRSTALNVAVGGAPRSRHITGEAADIHVPTLAIGRDWCTFIRHSCRYDELILEQRPDGAMWIHVALKR